MSPKVKKFVCWMILGIVVALLIMEIAAYFKEKNKDKNTAQAENKYLPGDLYLNYPPDPYPNFPGSIV